MRETMQGYFMGDQQQNSQGSRTWEKSCRLFCSFALAAGVLLLPSGLYAAPNITQGAKKAARPSSIAVVSKTAVKQRADKSKKSAKVAKADKSSRKQGVRVHSDKGKVAAKQAKAGRSHGNGGRHITGQTKGGKNPSPVQSRGRVVAEPTLASGEGPFLKRRAILSEQTRLANTLQTQLGVEVQEDPGHSGGLFIAPPATGTDHAAKAMDLLANLPLGEPVDPALSSISSGFGIRKDPFNGRRAFHEGIDFRAKTGTPVRSTGKGRVVGSGYSPDYGEHIIVSHGMGYETMFAHLSKRLVRVGDEIEPGMLIGLVGNSGRSTGAHLHYEIRYQGAPINPTDYVQATQQARLQKK